VRKFFRFGGGGGGRVAWPLQTVICNQRYTALLNVSATSTVGKTSLGLAKAEVDMEQDSRQRDTAQAFGVTRQDSAIG